MPPLVARVISSKLATINALKTELGAEDLHDLLEVMAVDGYNQAEIDRISRG